MKIEIEFETGNNSFQNGEDSAEGMIQQVAAKVREWETEGNLKDVNGNTIGKFKVTK